MLTTEGIPDTRSQKKCLSRYKRHFPSLDTRAACTLRLQYSTRWCPVCPPGRGGSVDGALSRVANRVLTGLGWRGLAVLPDSAIPPDAMGEVLDARAVEGSGDLGVSFVF